MAELDYAFVADYAKIEPTGTLTAVGASYTHVTVSALPATHLLSVAGRVRTRVEDPPVSLGIQFKSPDPGVSISLAFELAASPNARPYGDGQLGLLFAATSGLPIQSEGLYEVIITLDGQHARTLKFEVSLQAS